MTTEELQEQLRPIAERILTEHNKTDEVSAALARYIVKDRARAGITQDCWESEIERCLRDAEVI